jgi:hypothetical protein
MVIIFFKNVKLQIEVKQLYFFATT